MPKEKISEKRTTSSERRTTPFKITAVGDGMVGKTCLLITYTTNTFPYEYIPTVFDNYNGTITLDNETHEMTLWDTAGQEDYERLRPLSYPQTDCFILCYAVNSSSSYENVLSKWYPEIKHHCPNVPIILVGTKKDLRSNPKDKTQNKKEKENNKRDRVEFISTKSGKILKDKIKAKYFLECSALTSEGLDDVFIAAVKCALKKHKNKKKSCFCNIL